MGTPKDTGLRDLMSGLSGLALVGLIILAVAWGPTSLLITIAIYLYTGDWLPWGNEWLVSNSSLHEWLFWGGGPTDWRGLKIVLLWLHDKLPYPFAVFVLGMATLAICEAIRSIRNQAKSPA